MIKITKPWVLTVLQYHKALITQHYCIYFLAKAAWSGDGSHTLLPIKQIISNVGHTSMDCKGTLLMSKDAKLVRQKLKSETQSALSKARVAFLKDYQKAT